ncbi:hypothetical protein CBR_g29787 [Chara braunii]|uniref:Annexin n=1 Tax=Chara braunii TaxID=69332 RepID=A0A388LBF7_CHABU|nr:hypothetical protein CBR_g29787 [Chara braunii]|eukprot:GBG79638.1 hypothetical protein CBR_g29787 [Chara braunii]
MATIVGVHGFNVEDDAQVLRDALQSLDTDLRDDGVNTLIRLGTERSWSQRDGIVAYIKDTHEEWVPEMIKEKVHDKCLRSGLLALFEPAPWRDAVWLHDAMAGLGTDEKKLVEIICTRTSPQLAAVSAVYEALYGKELQADVAGETGGWFRTLLVKLITSTRSTEPADEDRAHQLAQDIYDAGPGKWGTDENTFIDILTQESADMIKAVFEAYTSKFEGNIFEAIESEFSGKIKENLVYLCRTLLSIPQVFADEIEGDVQGLGTDESGLVRHLIARADMDLVDIKELYKEKHKKSLSERVKEDCSGDFLKLLLAVIKDPEVEASD